MVSSASRLVLDLVARVGALADGETAQVPVLPGEEQVVAEWCSRTGNDFVEVRAGSAVVRRGRPPGTDEVLAELPPERRPGARLWLYTNFDCNLACDYCCSRSSPQAARRALGVEAIRRLVQDAAEARVSEVFLTGGEPFLLLDLDEIVAACTAYFPTTLLTNGMLFRGPRLDMLRRMSRDRLVPQISLDSATPERHDRHRGRGTWQRAVAGIRTALDEGFRVRVAATIPGDEMTSAEEETVFHVFLDDLGVLRADQIIRPVAQRGFAETGVALTVETLVPEITVTADGTYWHPVGAAHLDQLVTREIFPLDAAIEDVRRQFADHQRTMLGAARHFPCA
ncbi:MAG: radical SAM protein [Streptosporangiales bacterium]|nr:radical SAM protein [Streptosporangiales bacterium]